MHVYLQIADPRPEGLGSSSLPSLRRYVLTFFGPTTAATFPRDEAPRPSRPKPHLRLSAYYGGGVDRITQMSDSWPVPKITWVLLGTDLALPGPLTGGIRLAFVGGVNDLQQHAHDPGIELGPRVFFYLLERGFPGDAVAVRPGAFHVVGRGGHRDYSCYQGDVLPLE